MAEKILITIANSSIADAWCGPKYVCPYHSYYGFPLWLIIRDIWDLQKKQKQEKKPASHQIFTCSKLKIETLDKDVKYIQIQQ